MKRFFLLLGTVITATLLFFFTIYSEQTVQADSKTDTSTATIADPSTSVYGQSVTFTAAVTPSSPGPYTPTGDVVFNIVGYGQITGQLDSTAKATAATSALSPGTYVVFSTYNGDTNFNASISPVVIQTVTNASTTTSLTESTDTSIYGEPVTFTAEVAPAAPGTGTPTGTVIFSVSGYGSITELLDGSGKATATLDTISVGNQIITATYSGNASFYPSVSSAVNLTVNQASTTTALTSSANPSDPTQTVTFTANVAPVAPGSGTPTGTVNFIVDGTPSAPVTLASGTASYSTNTLASGSHEILAQYNGDSNFNTSLSPSLTQNVRTAASFSLSSSKNPGNRNDYITFTTVGLPDDATGNVTFFDGSTELGASVISDGKAEFTADPLSPSDHTITAKYSGDSKYLPSTSSDFTQTITTLYSYTIKYVNLLNGDSIAPDVQGSAAFGEVITVTAPQIDGYLLQDDTSKTFTIGSGSNTETFSYISVAMLMLFLIIVELIVAVTVYIILSNVE